MLAFLQIITPITSVATIINNTTPSASGWQTSQIVTSIIGSSAAVAAFLLAFFQYKSNQTQKVHNRNSVKPILQFESQAEDEEIFLRISNNGVGPGIVKKVETTSVSPSAASDISLGQIIENINGHLNLIEKRTNIIELAISPLSPAYLFLCKRNADLGEWKRQVEKYLKEEMDKSKGCLYTITYEDIYTKQQKPIILNCENFIHDINTMLLRDRIKKFNQADLKPPTISPKISKEFGGILPKQRQKPKSKTIFGKSYRHSDKSCRYSCKFRQK